MSAKFDGGRGTTFLDGAGSQTYSLASSISLQTPDYLPIPISTGGRVVFTRGHGIDTVVMTYYTSPSDFSTVPMGVIELQGFGPSMSSFAQVQAAATVTTDAYNRPTTTIATTDGGQIILTNFDKTALTSSMFAFSQGTASATVKNDLNGDGKSDLLWQRSDGLIVDWNMNGPTIASGGIVSALGADWKSLGVADFMATARPTCCGNATTA